jgi:hypothetical protein
MLKLLGGQWMMKAPRPPEFLQAIKRSHPHGAANRKSFIVCGHRRSLPA